jgi:hypothetical protein
LTRGGSTKGESVANPFEAILAHKLGADAPRDLCPTHAGEDADDAEAVAMDRMAEVMMKRGVDRRTAMGCAAAILEAQQARDAALAAVVVGGVDEAGAVADAMRSAMSWATNPDAMDRLCEAHSRVFGARDATLAMGCLLFAMGKPPYGFYSIRKLAAARGVSPQAAAVLVEDFQSILGLERTTQQKSEGARKAYARSNGALARHSELDTP